MKTCTICQNTKTLDLYHNCKKFKDGKYPQCKECKSKIDRAYYEKNQERVKTQAKAYYTENKTTILAGIDKEAKKEYRKEYYEINKELELCKSKEYKANNKGSLKIKKSLYRKNNRHKINEYRRYKRKTDPLFKLGLTIRNRTNDFLRNKGLTKNQKMEEYLGCSKEKLMQHLECQFTKEMTWENHGEVWQIDHILPLGMSKTEHHIYQLCHYKNLQPLINNDNFIKNNKNTTCWQKFQRDKNIEIDVAAGFPFDLQPKDFNLSNEQIANEHRDFIKKYEWLGSIGFGVKHCFTARWNGHLAGVVLMGEPNSREFGEKESLIQRGAVSSWAPKNLNSMLVMFSCRWMVKNTDKRYFTAYSDPDAGEIGTIYQACNFDYLGKDYGSQYLYRLPNGEIKGTRYFTRTSAMKTWAKELCIQWLPEWSKKNGFQNIKLIPKEIKDYAKVQINKCEKIKQSPKGKYVLLLNYGKVKIQKSWIPKPYPKRKI